MTKIVKPPTQGENASSGRQGTHAVKEGGLDLRSYPPTRVNDLNDSPQPRRNPPRANLGDSPDAAPRITQR